MCWMVENHGLVRRRMTPKVRRRMTPTVRMMTILLVVEAQTIMRVQDTSFQGYGVYVNVSTGRTVYNVSYHSLTLYNEVIYVTFTL